jgi:hypothetical protein
MTAVPITTMKPHAITRVEQLEMVIMTMIVVIAIKGKSHEEDVVRLIVIADLAWFLFEIWCCYHYG